MSAGQPADVVVRLDLRRHAVVAARLDHVRVERSLDEEPRRFAELARLLLEDADELLADDLALRLGIGDAGEPGQEPLLGAHVDERHVEVAAEGLDDLLRLVGAHQPVVDEHAGQLVADRLVDEQRRHGRVDATREPADDALRADLGPDPLDLLLDHGGGRPRRRSAGDLVEEVLQDLLPVGRVDDLGVELDGVEAAARVLERRDRRRRRRGGDAGAGRRRRDGVAVAHPDDLVRREVVEERRLAERRLGLAVLGDVVRLDVPAEVARHHLHPVTDPERRDPELEHVGVHLRRALGVDRGRAAGEDQRERVPRRAPRRP